MTRQLWTSLFFELVGIFILWMYVGFPAAAGVFIFVLGNNIGRTHLRPHHEHRKFD